MTTNRLLAAELLRELARRKLIRGAEIYPGPFRADGWDTDAYLESTALRDEALQHLASAEIFEAAQVLDDRPSRRARWSS